MGKGSVRRPTKVDQKTFARNWERIFEQTSQQQETPRREDSGAVGPESTPHADEDPVGEKSDSCSSTSKDDA